MVFARPHKVSRLSKRCFVCAMSKLAAIGTQMGAHVKKVSHLFKHRETKKKKEDSRAIHALKAPVMVRFSTQDQILFTKRLSMILKAGMPIMEGLHMLRDETKTSSGA